MSPRRNPDIVVAVLFEHGEWGKYSAKIAAQIVETFVEKQRRLAHNLRIADTPAPPPSQNVAGQSSALSASISTAPRN